MIKPERKRAYGVITSFYPYRNILFRLIEKVIKYLHEKRYKILIRNMQRIYKQSEIKNNPGIRIN